MRFVTNLIVTPPSLVLCLGQKGINSVLSHFRMYIQGYKGILCGSCEEGYGHFSGGECKKCQSSSITTWIVALVAIWSALLVSFEIINSVSANRDFLKGVNASFLNTHPVGSLPQESTTGAVSTDSSAECPIYFLCKDLGAYTREYRKCKWEEI